MRTINIIAVWLMLVITPLLLVGVWRASAQNYGLDKTAGQAGYTAAERQIEPLVERAVNGFLALLAILFLGLMLYGGLRWMTARGNEELSGRAKHAIEAAIIGLTIVVASYAIATLVFRLVGG
ncbi:MAG: hypothetical protein HYV42_01730 [Candidatus Magasanikbacteria bacterium]|nr:hypothetical protein [Candidatus Magasanikbacteria bacterium]